jgi:hypothetical protein
VHYEETLGGVAIDLRHNKREEIELEGYEMIATDTWTLESFGCTASRDHLGPSKGMLRERRTFAIGQNFGPPSNSEGCLAAADWLMHEIVHDSPVSGYT